VDKIEAAVVAALLAARAEADADGQPGRVKAIMEVVALVAELAEAEANRQPDRVKAITEQLRLRGYGRDGKPLPRRERPR
jgi:hypothetical protein